MVDFQPFRVDKNMKVDLQQHDIVRLIRKVKAGKDLKEGTVEQLQLDILWTDLLYILEDSYKSDYDFGLGSWH